MRPAIVVVTSPSGTERGKALLRVADRLGPSNVEIVDLEEDCLKQVIQEQFKAHHYSLAPIARLHEAATFQTITAHVPPDVMAFHWKAALNRAVSVLENSKKPFKFLSLHLTYYRSHYYEFYTPIALDILLAQTEIRSVVTLIDDVYDMYLRLSGEGLIFGIQYLVDQEHSKLKRRSKDAPKLTQDQKYLLALGQVAKTLHRLLVWREKEILAGQLLASQARSSHKLLAVKHPLDVGAAILGGPLQPDEHSPAETYLSHPITRPRLDRNKNGEWPSFVTEFHDFVDACAGQLGFAKRLALVMPTAIDEYRVLSDGAFLIPKLGDRWPLPIRSDRWPTNQPTDGLMYRVPGEYSDYSDYERRAIGQIFNPPIEPSQAGGQTYGRNSEDIIDHLDGIAKAEASGILKSLMLSIRQQIVERDFALVRQCAGILLYRPLYQEGEWSGGVQAEVQNWSDIVRCGEVEAPVKVASRRMVVLHADADTTDLESRAPYSKMADDVFRRLEEILGRSLTYLRDYFDRKYVQPGSDSKFAWLRAFTEPEEEIFLGGSNLSPEDAKNFKDKESEIRAAVELLVEDRLTVLRSGGAYDIDRNKVTVNRQRFLEDPTNSMPASELATFWSRIAKEVVAPGLLADRSIPPSRAN